MTKRKKAEKVFPREAEGFGPPRERVVKSVEKERPLILYSFPDIEGMRISVKAGSMEEAIKKAKEEARKSRGEVTTE